MITSSFLCRDKVSSNTSSLITALVRLLSTMSSPERHAQRQSQFVNHGNLLHSVSGERLSPSMPRTNSRVSHDNDGDHFFHRMTLTHNDQFAASRAANTQPTYDFLAGNSVSSNSHPVQPLQQTVRQSRATKAGWKGVRFIRKTPLIVC